MNKMKLLFFPLAFLLAGCSLSNINNSNNGPFDPNDKSGGQGGGSGGNITLPDSKDPEVLDPDIPDEPVINPISDVSKITDLSVQGISFDSTNNIFTITKAGEFIFSGAFEGNILVNAGNEDDVKITLNGATIKSSTDAPIKCLNANELQVSLKKSTTNYVYDERAHLVEEDDTQVKGAIYAACDMKLSGKGSLVLVGNYYNGLHTKDDLTLKTEVFEGSNIKIQSYNNCLKGNDSVEIQSGNIVLISTGGNGIITENTDVSSKGKQRGSVTISGGQVDIYSAKDAIDAAYDANIIKAEEATEEPKVNIYTSNFSKYSDEIVSSGETDLYIRVNSRLSGYLGVAFKDSDNNVTWKKATSLSSSQPQGGRTSYYYYSVEKPSNAVSMMVCMFANTVTEMSEANASIKMDSYESINALKDQAEISVSSSRFVFSRWSSYTSSSSSGGQWGGGPGGGWNPGGMQEGNTEKADVSAKGIKAENLITISAGEIYIKSYDDAVHCNYGEVLENGSTGIGNVNISGGNLRLYASDDALHADNELNVSGGTINVEYSYEGYEGNIINISGGTSVVYSTDDGLNAANKAGKTPAINISGGIVDVTVYGGDVDGIDSNGSFTQTGGIVITKGGNGGMSTGLDVDGTASVNGGTFIAFGQPEKTPSKGSGVSSYTLSGSWGIGSHKITLPDASSIVVSTKYSYSKVYVYSDSTTRISVE